MPHRSLISRRQLLAGAAGALALAPPGRAASLADFPFRQSGPIGPPGAAPLGLELHFFSVCCALLRWKGGSLLLDPFFTHLPLRQVAFGRTREDPAALGDRAPLFADTRAVLVGHAHYDHAMGLPLVDPHLGPDAVTLGSRTLAHTFAASGLRHPIVALNDHLARPGQPARWWAHPSGALRVMPLLAGHPPQYLFFHLWRRQLRADRDRPPTRANHYQEGVTLAFLVDLLHEGEVRARVYVCSSSADPPSGFPDAAVIAERPVDLALVSMDTANREAAHGDSVLGLLGARTVVFTHYEDFFRPKTQAPREIVKVDLERSRAYFAARSDADYVFPAWGGRFTR